MSGNLGGEEQRAKRGEAAPSEKEASTGRMHQNVPVWSDPTCACEAEPYWQAVGEEREEREKLEKDRDQDSEPC